MGVWDVLHGSCSLNNTLDGGPRAILDMVASRWPARGAGHLGFTEGLFPHRREMWFLLFFLSKF